MESTKKSHRKKNKSKVLVNGNENCENGNSKFLADNSEKNSINDISSKLESAQICGNGTADMENGNLSEISNHEKKNSINSKNEGKIENEIIDPNQSANNHEIANHNSNHNNIHDEVKKALVKHTNSNNSTSSDNNNLDPTISTSSSSNENSEVSTEISEISIATPEKCLYVYKADTAAVKPSISIIEPVAGPSSYKLNMDSLMETIRQDELKNEHPDDKHHVHEYVRKEYEEKAPSVISEFGNFEEEKVQTIKNAGSDDEIIERMKDGQMIRIRYKVYESELEMPDIMRLIQKDLSEPYSVYTYRYFIHNWPKLCFLALHEDKCVGAIVCKLDIHRQTIKRGYIAMLAVDKDYRKLKIGTTLVQKAIRVSKLNVS